MNVFASLNEPVFLNVCYQNVRDSGIVSNAMFTCSGGFIVANEYESGCSNSIPWISDTTRIVFPINQRISYFQPNPGTPGRLAQD